MYSNSIFYSLQDLVKKWRTIVQEEENSAVQHHSPPNFINTNSNCSTQSSGSNGSNNNGHVVHLAPSNSHHKTLSKHHRRNVVTDSPRPGTAPTSPARGRSLQPAENISRHSAPSSPASSGRHNTTVPSSSHNGAPHFPHQPPSHAVPPVRPSSPSLREVNNVANSFSRTNVANKRLRKEECINLVDEDQEPPYKRQRIAELPPPNPQQSKSLTNGGMVGDDDVISVGSSSGGSCEVIDSIDRPPPPPVFNLHQLSRASNYNHHSDISSSNVNNKSGNKRGPVGPVSPYPSESLPDGSIRLLPSSTEGLLNHATAPHDILANQSIPSAKTPSSARAGRGRGRRRSMVPSPDIKIPPNKGKVKTTSQLVAELAERKGDTMLAQRASKLEEQQKSHDDMARNKIDHVHRYVRSLPTPPPLCDPKSPLESSPLSSPVIISPEPNEDLPIEVSRPSLVPNPTDQENTQENPFSGMLDRLGVADDETEEQLLSRLPPIDFEAAAAADEQDAILDQKSYGHTGMLT